MTKKDYIKAAEIVKFHQGSKMVRQNLADAFVQLFKGDNPRFDEGRFRSACEPAKKK